ncbi:MAG: hypothetical protein PHE55_07675 [Methylococcaceae bacterium]|nr:hypothetical protein [Methylococcaceae bacterium]
MPALPGSIEIFPNREDRDEFSSLAPQGKRNRRPFLFLTSLLLFLAVGLAYVWLRAPVYQSAASLTIAREEVVPAGAAAATVENNLIRQLMAEQQQILLGSRLLEETLLRLNENRGVDRPALRLADVGGMLSVVPIEQTQVIELRASGPKAEILAPLVNAWIDAYQELRSRTLRNDADNTADALGQESRQLELKIETKRGELERFRTEHGILSRTDTENQAVARLKGLNETINKATEEEVKTKAALESIRTAIAQGEPVLAPGEKQGVESLEKRAQELREQLQGIKRRYTPGYMALDPQLKLVPEQLAQVENQIRGKLEEGKHEALSQAEQAYASARQAVLETRRQAEAHKREATQFTTDFAKQEAMQAEVEKLESIHGEIQAKLARIESRPQEKYPPLRVLERAYPPTQPVWPDYWKDSGIALAVSLAAALAGIGLYDYLTRRDTTPNAPQTFQIYPYPERILPQYRQEPSSLPHQPVPLALEAPFPRELTEPELRLLFETADSKTKQWAGLLLSGLSLEEAIALRLQQLDLAANRILVAGEPVRSVPLSPRLKTWLMQSPSIWDYAMAPDSGEVSALIACAAVDSGLSQPGAIDAAALRHSYIVYLVRQGIRLSELENIVGPLPVKTLASYGHFSPPGPGLPAEKLPLLHPVLER